MIVAIQGRVPRGTLFLAFNILVMLVIVAFLLTPILGHFTSRSDEISESAAQLAHFRKLARSASIPKRSSSAEEPFLPGVEERVVSADLQAGLKGIAANAGVILLGIRGLQGSRYQHLRMVAVGVELEGSLVAVRDMIAAIENQTPFLFVTSASLRSLSEGEDGTIRAELKVQGAMRDGQPSGAPEMGSQ
jgi:hypothetical protein